MDNLVLVGGGLLLLTDKLQQIQNPYSLTKRRFTARAHFSLLQDSRLHAFVWQTKECIQPTIVGNSQHPHWLSKNCEAPELGPFSPLGNESFKHVELQGQSICVHVLLKAIFPERINCSLVVADETDGHHNCLFILYWLLHFSHNLTAVWLHAYRQFYNY